MSPKKIHELLGLNPMGRYIDVGAFNGLKGSKTKYFEDIGWEGIAVEPHPISFLELESNRTCEKENILITDYDGESNFNWSEQAPMTSRIDMSGYRCRIHEMSDVQEAQLECMTITSLCEKYLWEKVNFLKIDAEGSDWAVIKGIDFAKLSIDFIAFEMWGNHKPEEYALAIDKLQENGFVQIWEDRSDYYYTSL